MFNNNGQCPRCGSYNVEWSTSGIVCLEITCPSNQPATVDVTANTIKLIPTQMKTSKPTIN